MWEKLKLDESGYFLQFLFLSPGTQKTKGVNVNNIFYNIVNQKMDRKKMKFE